MTDLDESLERLAAKIAGEDALGTSRGAWRAAALVHDQAVLVRRERGNDAALALYEEAAQRLVGRSDSGPRSMWISTMNTIAVIHMEHGRYAESQAAAEVLVQEHFDDAPLDAAEAIANATLLLARLLKDVGDRTGALALLDRLIERYGQPGIPGHLNTRAAATLDKGWIRSKHGDANGAQRCYTTVIELLGDQEDVDLRYKVVAASIWKADLLCEQGLLGEARALCERVVQGYADDDDPEIHEFVAWARTVLDELSRGSRRRWPWSR